MGNLAHDLLANDAAMFAKIGFHNTLPRAVLECGAEMEAQPLTFDEAWRVVNNVHFSGTKRLRDFSLGQCFYNSQRVAVWQIGDLEYCEGFYADHAVPIAVQHAWLRIDGKVIDLTARRLCPRREKFYFGVPVPVDRLREHILETGRWSPFLEGPFSLEFFRSLGVEWSKQCRRTI